MKNAYRMKNTTQWAGRPEGSDGGPFRALACRSTNGGTVVATHDDTNSTDSAGVALSPLPTWSERVATSLRLYRQPRAETT